MECGHPQLSHGTNDETRREKRSDSSLRKCSRKVLEASCHKIEYKPVRHVSREYRFVTESLTTLPRDLQLGRRSRQRSPEVDGMPRLPCWSHAERATAMMHFRCTLHGSSTRDAEETDDRRKLPCPIEIDGSRGKHPVVTLALRPFFTK